MNHEHARFQSFEEVRSIAETFALTGYFDAKGNNPVEIAKATAKILAGQEMGFGPFASMNGIYILYGRPSLSAGMMASAVKRSDKYDYRVRETTDAICRIEFYEKTEKGLESLGIAEFTAEDAHKAGTQNMNKFPADMLFARCMSRGVRRFCPDVFQAGSVYTPEELGAIVNEEGEVVETPVGSTGNGNGNGTHSLFADQEPWETWQNKRQAVEWAMHAGFGDADECEAAYARVRADVKPTTQREMFAEWYGQIQKLLDAQVDVDFETLSESRQAPAAQDGAVATIAEAQLEAAESQNGDLHNSDVESDEAQAGLISEVEGPAVVPHGRGAKSRAH